MLRGVLPKSVSATTTCSNFSSILAGKDIFFDMQVDTQFPNIFREKKIKQPFNWFHIRTNIEAKASQLVNTLLEKLN